MRSRRFPQCKQSFLGNTTLYKPRAYKRKFMVYVKQGQDPATLISRLVNKGFIISDLKTTSYGN